MKRLSQTDQNTVGIINNDATASYTGSVRLTGDLGGTATSPETKSRAATATVGTTTGDYPVSSYANFNAALLAAMTAAQAVAGEVYIKPGTYDLSSQLVFHDLSNVTIRGAGLGKTTIRRTFAGSNSMIDLGSGTGPTVSSNITIEDLTIDQNSTGSGWGLVASWCKNVLIQNCAFINQNSTSFSALLLGKFANADDNFEANNIRVVNCLFDYSNAASLAWEVVTVTGGRDVSFEGCRWVGIASNWPGLSIYNTEQFRMANCFVNDAQITFGGRGTYVVLGTQFEQSLLLINQAKNSYVGGGTTFYSFGTTTGLPNGIKYIGGYKTGNDAETPWYIPQLDFATSAVDTSTDTFTLSSTTGFPTGTPVRITTTGTLPGGVTNSTTDYYVINTGGTTIQLAASEADALTGTEIDITSQGSGTHTITVSTVFSCENAIVEGVIFKGGKSNAIYAKTTTENGKEVLDCRDLTIANCKFEESTEIPVVAFGETVHVTGCDFINCNTENISNASHIYVAGRYVEIAGNTASSTNITTQDVIVDLERFTTVLPSMVLAMVRNNFAATNSVRYYNSGGTLTSTITTNVSLGLTALANTTLASSTGDLLILNGTGSNNSILRFKDDGTERGAVFNTNGSNDLTVRAQSNVVLTANNSGTPASATLSSTGLGVGNSATAGVDAPASTTSRASFRLRSGTAPTSPNDGDVWLDGTHLNVRIGGVTYQLDQQAGSLTDGDKGDITVSASGATWTVDPGAITYAKIQDVSATDKVLGRSTAGAGDVEEITMTSAGRALVDDADATAQRATLGLTIGTNVQAYDADLDAVAGLSANGLVARTGAGTASARTITGTANQITVNNGDGVSGNPTLSTPQNIGTGSTPTFAGANLNGSTSVSRGTDATGLTVANTTAGGNTNPNTLIRSVTATSSGLAMGIATDTVQRFQSDVSGKMEWGAGGSSSRDTNLYRSAADTLKTDDSLDVGGSLTLGTDLAITEGGTGASTASAAFSNLKQDATSSATGVVELATAAETTTGTDAARAITPDGLAGSDYGKRVVQIQVTDPNGSDITTGDGKAYFTIPSELNGYNLVGAHASVTTVSSSGLPTVQIANVTQAADMLSTKITIDASENTSYTAAAAPVIDTGNDDVATGDILRVDIDVAGTGAKGLSVILSFQLP